MKADEIEALRKEFIEERISMILADISMPEQEATDNAVKMWLKYKRDHGWLEQYRML